MAMSEGRTYSKKGYDFAVTPPDVTGGYLLELEMSDRYGLEPSGFITNRRQCVVIKNPKYANYEEVSYIANRFQDLEDAVRSPDGISQYTGVSYQDYLDLPSFAAKYILEEYLDNADASFTIFMVIINRHWWKSCGIVQISLAYSFVTYDTEISYKAKSLW